MQYCGNCGVPLTSQEALAGQCPVCHAPVSPPPETIPAPTYDETPDRPQAHSFPEQVPAQPHHPARAGMHISVLGQVDVAGKIELQPPPAKRSSSRALVALLALVVLLLALSVAAVALVVINPHSGQVTTSIVTATAAAHATETATTSATAVIGVEGGTLPAGQPTHIAGTGTPHTSTTTTPGASPTSSPNAPVLVVTPNSFTLSVCAANKVTFSIENTGGSTLKWVASSHYTLSQSQDVLAAGGSDSVTASNILQSGTVTVTATDINGNPLPSSPQTVTVTCKL